MDVIMLMAMTVDGKIARNSIELVDWSGKEDKEYFVKITRQTGVIIMGSKTYDTVGKPLPDRKNIVLSRDKQRKSYDKNLIFTDKSPDKILMDLESQGYKKAVLIGGSRINTLFARHNLITEIHMTVAPLMFGKGLSLFDEPMAMELELIETTTISKNHVLLKYRVIN